MKKSGARIFTSVLMLIGLAFTLLTIFTMGIQGRINLITLISLAFGAFCVLYGELAMDSYIKIKERTEISLSVIENMIRESNNVLQMSDETMLGAQGIFSFNGTEIPLKVNADHIKLLREKAAEELKEMESLAGVLRSLNLPEPKLYVWCKKLYDLAKKLIKTWLRNKSEIAA
jgi:hypothetical protein